MDSIYRSCVLIIALLLFAVVCSIGAYIEFSHHEDIGAYIFSAVAVLFILIALLGTIVTRDDYRQYLIEEVRRG